MGGLARSLSLSKAPRASPHRGAFLTWRRRNQQGLNVYAGGTPAHRHLRLVGAGVHGGTGWAAPSSGFKDSADEARIRLPASPRESLDVAQLRHVGYRP